MADLSSRCRIGGYGEMVFLFNDTATTEIYTLSLHDALPIFLLLLLLLEILFQVLLLVQVGPSWDQDGPSWSQGGPSWSQVGPNWKRKSCDAAVLGHLDCNEARTSEFDDSTAFCKVFVALGQAWMASKWRLEASLNGQVESKWHLEASLKGQMESQ